MSAFKIEKGIKKPDSSAGRKSVYPFANMKVGDSFLAIGKSQSNVISAACQWKLRYKKSWSFTSRQAEGGARIWRTK